MEKFRFTATGKLTFSMINGDLSGSGFERLTGALAEGDTVALHCTHSGRHVGDYFGIAPTGRSFSYRQMHLIRFDGARGVEHWAVRDDAGLLRQLTGAPEGPV